MCEEDDTRYDEIEEHPEEESPPLPPPDHVAIPMTPWGPMLPLLSFDKADEEEDEEQDGESDEEDDDRDESLARLREEAASYLSMN